VFVPLFLGRSAAREICLDAQRRPRSNEPTRIHRQFVDGLEVWLAEPDECELVLEVEQINCRVAERMALAVARSGSLVLLDLPRPISAAFWSLAALSSTIRYLSLAIDSRATAAALNRGGILGRLDSLAISCVAPDWVELIAAPIAASRRLRYLTLHDFRARTMISDDAQCCVGLDGVCGCVHLVERLLLRGDCGHAPDALKISRSTGQRHVPVDAFDQEALADEWNGCACPNCRDRHTEFRPLEQTYRFLAAVAGTRLATPHIFASGTRQYLGFFPRDNPTGVLPVVLASQTVERNELMDIITKRRRRTIDIRVGWRMIAFLVAFTRANAASSLSSSGLSIARAFFGSASKLLTPATETRPSSPVQT
jgi:hypothetical protein